jgi:hypothetical protein
VIAPNDARLIPKQRELAKIALRSGLNKAIGKYLGKLAKGQLSQADVGVITGLGIANITVASTRADLDHEADQKAAADAANADLNPYLAPAIAALQNEDYGPHLAQQVQIARQHFEQQLADKLTTERLAVTAAGFAGGAATIAGFWQKPDGEQEQAIKAEAGRVPIPFTSDESAAYHALKHYADIENTQDRAAQADGKLLAYLQSARETVRNPNRIERKPDQFQANPGFFFYRTIPAAQGIVGGAPKDMRAIVIVTAGGVVMIATYFKAA